MALLRLIRLAWRHGGPSWALACVVRERRLGALWFLIWHL